MKSLTKLTGIVLLLCVTLATQSQDKHVRIAFIGNSITIGSGLTNAPVECYPSQIDTLLRKKYGDTCILKNFAVSGRTLLKKGDFPIWNEPDFKNCWNYAPDICFIKLGTNDSKDQNWGPYGTEFLADFKAMVDTFRYRNPLTKFIVCYPCPAFSAAWTINDSIILHGVMPAVDSIVKYANAVLVDFRTPLLGSSALFADGIHPNAAGAKIMAKIAFDTIVSSNIVHKVKHGYTFVTSLISNIPGDLPLKSSVTFSWTTIDATEVFLNGVKVDANGSYTVTPTATTKYTLVAKGALNSDSLTFVQAVYKPALTTFYTSISNSSVKLGDTLTVSLIYYDQKKKKITDTTFNATWKVTEGSGQFINNGNNKVDFIANIAGKVVLTCTINGITSTAKFTVKEDANAISITHPGIELQAYPNPVNKIAFLKMNINKPSGLNIRVYDINGRLCLDESKNILSIGEQVIELNFSKLLKGAYTFEVENNGKYYMGKILKQ